MFKIIMKIKLVEIGDVEHEDIADNRIAVFDKVGTVMDDQSVCELSSASKPLIEILFLKI